MDQQEKVLTFIHFNDVYDIEEQEKGPTGGAARFVNQMKKYKQDKGVIIFSGDAFSPSIISSLFKGQQMVLPLNEIGIDAACIGNHELDFCETQLQVLIDQANFPWLLSNVIIEETNQRIGNGPEYLILEKFDKKIGVFAVAEEEWLATIHGFQDFTLKYEDYISCGKRLSQILLKQGCDMIICISHMRVHNDEKLCENVQEIDIIFGGHDHIKYHKQINNCLLIKSGQNFQNFSLNHIYNYNESSQLLLAQSNEKQKFVNIKNKWIIETQLYEVTAEMEQDQKVKEHVNYYLDKLNDKFQQKLGYSKVDLDTRFEIIRNQESTMLNFFCDMIRIHFGTDCALVNSGCLRSDCIFQKGELKYGMIKKMFPFLDTIVVKKVRGDQLHQLLESGVSAYPAFEGRFPGVSKIKFKFNPVKPAMQRISKQDIQVHYNLLDYETFYTVAMTEYCASGKDGFELLKDCPYIIDPEHGIANIEVLINFFVNIPEKFNSHLQLKKALSQKNANLLDSTENSQQIFDVTQSLSDLPDLRIKYKFLNNLRKLMKSRYKDPDGVIQYTVEGMIHQIKTENNINYVEIAPKIKGRIVQIIPSSDFIKRSFSFIHFNDAYDIEEQKQEPKGGVARFLTAIQQYKKNDTLTFFSGDVFAPSMLSTLFQGEQMIKPLNSFGIDVACYGNHEFDYTEHDIEALIKQTNFPWILSNVYHLDTNKRLCDAHEYFIIQKNQIKLGFIGLAEEEWLGVMKEFDPKIIGYEDFITCAKRICKYLREIQHCDIIIALTHMRNPNDIKLAKQVPDIDIILGGHDHVKYSEKIRDTFILKSGSNFQDLTFNTVEFLDQTQDNSFKDDEQHNQIVIKNKLLIKTEFVQVSSQFAPNPELQDHVNTYLLKCEDKYKEVMGYSECELETQFCVIRGNESNFGNFFADIIRIEMHADCAIINAGTIRSDCLFEKGQITLGMIKKMFPFQDIMVVKQLTGEQLHIALENGVSKYPAYDGRFPLLSNIKIIFDPSKPPMSRILKQDIFVKDQPLDYQKIYSVATKYFLSIGKDGYEIFSKCPFLVDEEQGTPHMVCLRNFFNSSHNNKQREKKKSVLIQQAIIDQIIKNQKKQVFQIEENNIKYPESPQYMMKEIKFQVYKSQGLIKSLKTTNHQEYIVINPTIENRIQIVQKQTDQNQQQ